ncbi:MAG: DUF1318 domain-containing protein [Verrucomicrobiota bacterium]
MRTIRILFIFCLPLSLFSSVDTVALKERFAERLPSIEKLWMEGMIGENNQGYVTPRENLSRKNKKLVEAENADRKIAYELIAARSDVPAIKVGQQRAVQIAEQAADGLWLQNAQGEWYQKES